MSVERRLAIASSGFRGDVGGGTADGADFCVFSPPNIVDTTDSGIVVAAPDEVVTIVSDDITTSVGAGDVVVVDDNETITVQSC